MPVDGRILGFYGVKVIVVSESRLSVAFTYLAEGFTFKGAYVLRLEDTVGTFYRPRQLFSGFDDFVLQRD